MSCCHTGEGHLLAIGISRVGCTSSCERYAVASADQHPIDLNSDVRRHNIRVPYHMDPPPYVPMNIARRASKLGLGTFRRRLRPAGDDSQ